MKSRDISLKDFIKNMKEIRISEEEEKEVNLLIRKTIEIERLRNETNQKKDNYNYFKIVMLPSDYKKIDNDLLEQRKYKVARETHKYLLELKEKGISEEQIKLKVEEYRQQLCKHYGIRK